jgi:hypothetical protein
MSKYEALLKAIQFLTQTIAALSTRQYPPHGTIAGLQKKLDIAVSALSN